MLIFMFLVPLVLFFVARSPSSTAPAPSSSTRPGSAVFRRLSDRARQTNWIAADRHRDGAVDRLPNRLLPDDRDRRRREASSCCQSYCRISPAHRRTFSWMVLLGEHGLVNDVLMATG